MLRVGSSEGVVDVLYTTAVRPALTERTSSVVEVEKHLHRFLAEQYTVPLPFLRGPEHRIIYWLWRRFELDNLLMLLRGIHNSAPPERIRSSLVPLNTHSAIDWQSICRARSIEELCDRLRMRFRADFYVGVIEQAMDVYHKQQSIFVLEAALYRAYYRKLNWYAELMRGQEREQVRRLLGFLVDSRDVLWAYRLRAFFDASPELILSYTIPHGRRVGSHAIREIAQNAPLAEMVARIWNAELGDISHLGELPLREALTHLEILFARYQYRSSCKLLAGNPFSLATIIAYGSVVEADIRDVVTILEAKAANWDAERLRAFTIGERA